MSERMNFCDVFKDVTKQGRKLQTSEYFEKGLYPIYDQGKNEIAGYTNETEGLFTDVPVILFGDHTRVVKYVNQSCFLGADGVKLLKPKLSNVNAKYLYYAVRSIPVPDTGYNRHFKWLKESTISIPNEKEQEKTVDILEKTEELISLRKKQLQKLDDLIKTRFVEMFGDPVTNPKGWEKRFLSDEAEIRIGPFGSLLHKEDYISGGHPLINPSHIVDGRVSPDDNLTLTDEKYEELAPYHLQEGDVVMGRRGEMGRCAVVDCSGFLCGTGSLIIRSKGDLSADYIQKIISYPTFRRTIEDMAVGQTMPNLNVPIVSGFQIIKPPKEVQQEYYNFFSQIDKSKLSIQQSLEKLETLKQSLMQQYFG